MQKEHSSSLRSSSTRLHLYLDLVFGLGLLIAVLVVLAVPVFPSGDGPVHLYYADVLWSLLQHQQTYAHDYAIRHLFAPYLVHYLALISFEHFVSPPMAEKLFIAIILLTIGSGFRFLAGTLGREQALVSVWMLPLLLSWSLAGGFLNCCFATGVMLWAFGVWNLLGQSPDKPKRNIALLFAFLLLLVLLLLSHPIPLMVLLLFSGSDLLLQWLARWAAKMPDGEPHLDAPPRNLGQVVGFGMTCIAFAAPVMLAQKGQAAAVLPGIGFHVQVFETLIGGAALGYFGGLSVHSLSGVAALISRIGLISMLPGVAVLLYSSARPSHPGTLPNSRAAWLRTFLRRAIPNSAAGRLVLISVLYVATTVFFPRSLNHSFFFPERMWDIVWLLVLAAGAGIELRGGERRRLALAGLVLGACTAACGGPALFHIARAQAELASAPLPAGKRGLYVAPFAAVANHNSATTYPVYFWSGARAFAASKAILLNSPWLGLTILPIRDASTAPVHGALLDHGLPGFISESPTAVTALLARGTSDPQTQDELATLLPRSQWEQDRREVLTRADFILYVNPASIGAPSAGGQTRSEALALLRQDSAAWVCDAHGFYTICNKKG